MPRHPDAGERGATAVEYGLIVFAIAAVIVIALFAFGGQVVGLFGHTCHAVANKTAPATDCG